MTPRISVIIISFNTKQTTLECLKSLYKYSKDTYVEIIVVDNSSQDGSPDAIDESYPEVRLIRNKKNLGFGSANNQGAKVAKGEYLLFINSDILLLENSVKKIINWVQTHPKSTVTGCKLLNQNLSLQYSLGSRPNLGNVLAWMLFLDDLPWLKKYIPAYHLEHPDWYSMDREVGWVMGAFFLISKKIYWQVNGFDEKMFMYGEEVELQMRLARNGYKVFYTPVTSVIHLGSQSSNRHGSAFSRTSELKGILYIFRKHYPGWRSFAARVFISIGVITRIIVFGTIRRDMVARKIYVQAIKHI